MRKKELSKCVRSTYALYATWVSILNELFRQRREKGGYGNSIEEVIRESTFDSFPKSYNLMSYP